MPINYSNVLLLSMHPLKRLSLCSLVLHFLHSRSCLRTFLPFLHKKSCIKTVRSRYSCAAFVIYSSMQEYTWKLYEVSAGPTYRVNQRWRVLFTVFSLRFSRHFLNNMNIFRLEQGTNWKCTVRSTKKFWFRTHFTRSNDITRHVSLKKDDSTLYWTPMTTFQQSFLLKQTIEESQQHLLYNSIFQNITDSSISLHKAWSVCWNSTAEGRGQGCFGK